MKQTTEKVFALSAAPTKPKAADKSTENSPAQEVARSQHKRVGWSGGVKAEELKRPGGKLLGMLIQRANELGHQMGDMAEELGVTYGYISQLRNGQRQVTTIRDKFVDACAVYLGVPRLTVLLAADKVKPSDIYEDPLAMWRAVPSSINFIRRDAEYGPLMTPEILSADLQTQFFVVKLYEAATKRKLLPEAPMDPKVVAEQIQKLVDYQDQLKARIASTADAEDVEEA